MLIIVTDDLMTGAFIKGINASSYDIGYLDAFSYGTIPSDIKDPRTPKSLHYCTHPCTARACITHVDRRSSQCLVSFLPYHATHTGPTYSYNGLASKPFRWSS